MSAPDGAAAANVHAHWQVLSAGASEIGYQNTAVCRSTVGKIVAVINSEILVEY